MTRRVAVVGTDRPRLEGVMGAARSWTWWALSTLRAVGRRWESDGMSSETQGKVREAGVIVLEGDRTVVKL